MPSFSSHYYYIDNFENHYWILHTQYQFTIIVREILLNTTQNKKEWTSSIVSPKLNGDKCMRSFSLTTIF